MRITQLFALSLVSTAVQANPLADALVENLYAMKSIYRTEYAPADWKRQYAHYDLDAAFHQAVTEANANPNLTQTEARDILRSFIYAMKDYHVSITFVATEEASLPLTIKSADNRFFLAYIDRTKLPESAFPFHIGDELISFDGKPALQAVTELQQALPENVAGTDRAKAELALTYRTAARHVHVPQGAVSLGIQAAESDKVSYIQMNWDYKSEQVPTHHSLMHKKTNPLFKLPVMDVDFDEKFAADNPYGLGMRQSFLPDLGTKIWQSEANNTFHAYIYMDKQKNLIGYVRLPTYHVNDFDKAIADFKAIITRFETSTNAMIIDQVDNPGGSVLYMYALASMLSDQPLKTPQHRMSITQADVLAARKSNELLKNVKSDEEARKVLEEMDGYPPSYEFVQFLMSYNRFIISEWEAGRHLTRPFWLGGVDHINPAPQHYTHPILLLTNHLDYSCADFFPSILQDNQRITILGSRTAGAGGYVNNVSIPNNIGIDYFRVTESIAERINGNPIENLGVTPDIPYEMTPADYQYNFQPYTVKIKATLEAMLS